MTGWRKFLGIFSALIIGFGTTMPSYAGITDSAILEVSPPTTVKGKEMTTIYGGGIRWRIKDETFRPFNVVPPSIRSGCGGIDATFGAFSYFNMEYLGQFLQNVLSAAPVIAFDLALHTLCPQCEQLLKNLTALANQINQISHSKCASIAFATKAGEMLIDKALGRTDSSGSSQQQSDAFKTFNDFITNLSGLVDQARQTIAQWCPGGNCLAGLLLNKGEPFSFVDMSVKEMPPTMASLLGISQDQLALLIRAYVGDVGVKPVDKNNADGAFQYIGPAAHVENFVKDVIGLTSQNGQPACGSFDGTAPAYAEVSLQSWNFNTSSGQFEPVPNGTIQITPLCYWVSQYTQSIKQKIVARQPLSNEEYLLLASMPAPVITLVNVASVDPGLLDVIFNKMNIYMSAELANAYIRALMRGVQKWGSACMSEPYVKKKPENAKACEMFLSNVGRVARDTFDVSVKYQKELAEAIQTANVAYNLYSRLLAQMSNNNLYGNLMYSKMLGVVR
ncbi:MAG: conjugal transfer protein TraH [Sulfolobales archaeon]